MNNRLKFRAWDAHNLHYSVDYNSLEAFFAMTDDSGYGKFRTIYQQFTSLRDSANKDIYEGDIVEKDGEIGQIKWSNICAAFCFDKYGKQSPLFRLKPPTIIGNIFETQELLK